VILDRALIGTTYIVSKEFSRGTSRHYFGRASHELQAKEKKVEANEQSKHTTSNVDPFRLGVKAAGLPNL
jgi:hypothetical protein